MTFIASASSSMSEIPKVNKFGKRITRNNQFKLFTALKAN